MFGGEECCAWRRREGWTGVSSIFIVDASFLFQLVQEEVRRADLFLRDLLRSCSLITGVGLGGVTCNQGLCEVSSCVEGWKSNEGRECVLGGRKKAVGK